MLWLMAVGMALAMSPAAAVPTSDLGTVGISERDRAAIHGDVLKAVLDAEDLQRSRCPCRGVAACVGP